MIDNKGLEPKKSHIGKYKNPTRCISEKPRSRSRLAYIRSSKKEIRNTSIEIINACLGEVDQTEHIDLSSHSFKDNRDSLRLERIINCYIEKGIDPSIIVIGVMKVIYPFWKPSREYIADKMGVTLDQYRRLSGSSAVQEVMRSVSMAFIAPYMTDIIHKQRELALMGYTDAAEFMMKICNEPV